MAGHQVNNAAMRAPGMVKITAKEFEAKYRSKREVYHFLSVDCGIYLPAYGKWPKTAFLTLIFPTYRANYYLVPQGRGQREEAKYVQLPDQLTHITHIAVLSKNAKHISVPHYEKLTLETIK